MGFTFNGKGKGGDRIGGDERNGRGEEEMGGEGRRLPIYKILNTPLFWAL